MPGETTSEVMEQQVSTVEEDSPKQSRPDLPDNELSDDPNEPTSSSSRNVLTNGLKRPLPDGVDSDKKKKFRLNDTSEDELEVTNKDDSGKNHIELLIQKVSESLENTIGDKEANVSNKTHDNLRNETNSSFNMINHNGNNGIDEKDCKDDNPDKNTLSKDISKDREIKTSIINNASNSCEFIGNSKDTVINGEDKLTKNDILTSNGISCLNKSSSENLGITENSDHENENVAVVNDIQVRENIYTVVNESTVGESNLNHLNTKISTTENNVNSKKTDAEPLPKFNNKIQHLTKNTDETETMESCPCTSNTKGDVCSNGIDQDFEGIEFDNTSHISCEDLTDLPEDISSIINGVKQITKESFPQLLKLFSKKELTYDQFDSMCTQKMIEMMTERLYWGKERSELQLLKEREKHWRSKFCSLNRQFREIKTIINVHKQDLKTDEHAKPHLVTRTVGLQAVLCAKKEGSMKLPKLAIPLSQPDPVSIIVEDDDDVIELVTVESTSSSTSEIANTTTKKQIPPLVTTSKSLVVSPKNVTASPKTVITSPKTVITSPKTVITSPKTVITSPKTVITSPKTVITSPKIVTAPKSLNSINIGTTTTIDLTGNDDAIEESNIIDLEDTNSPVKVFCRNPAAILPVGKVNGNVSKTYTYVELPNNSSSSSSFIMRTAPGSPQRAIVSNKDTVNTSLKSKNLKPILIDVSQISGTLQPMSTASYTPRQITVSQLSASLKTLTPSYTTCQLPVSHISGSMPGIALSQASPETSFTTCRLPISLHTIPHTGSQLTRKPPPPAIPLLGHPSPVPGIPNQKSLPTWKRLPPAPNLTIAKTLEAQNIPQGTLVLSWTMNINKTIAEVISYQIYAYQETPDQPPNIDLWKRIGVVNALPLPMACSLTHFSNGQKYHFLVRAVDVYSRVGPFSSPESIT
ncbi:hypothetical protein QTP88_002569 [Uroleucon formosanum]